MTQPDARAFSDRLVRRLLIAAVACLAVAASAYVLMVRTRLGQRFDNAALVGAFQQNSSARLSDSFFVAKTSAVAFCIALLVVIGVSLYRRRLRVGIALAVTAVLAVLITHGLKVDVLTRPVLVASDSIQYKNSYPSGHTATAIAAALVLVVVMPPAFRGAMALLAGTYAAAIAQDVQTAGWHRPSDAIGAAFVVFALVAIVTAALARVGTVGTGRQRTHVVAYPVLGLAALVGGAYCVLDSVRAVHLLVRTNDSPTIAPALRNEVHQFSIGLTVLVVALLMALLLALLGSADLGVPRRRSRPAG